MRVHAGSNGWREVLGQGLGGGRELRGGRLLSDEVETVLHAGKWACFSISCRLRINLKHVKPSPFANWAWQKHVVFPVLKFAGCVCSSPSYSLPGLPCNFKYLASLPGEWLQGPSLMFSRTWTNLFLSPQSCKGLKCTVWPFFDFKRQSSCLLQ